MSIYDRHTSSVFDFRVKSNSCSRQFKTTNSESDYLSYKENDDEISVLKQHDLEKPLFKYRIG